MAFTGKEDHKISLEEAKQMTAAFRSKNPESPRAWYFGREAIEKILAQESVVGIRIYGGHNDEGQMSPVLVGVTTKGEDLFGGELAELSFPCPPDCPEESPL